MILSLVLNGVDQVVDVSVPQVDVQQSSTQDQQQNGEQEIDVSAMIPQHVDVSASFVPREPADVPLSPVLTEVDNEDEIITMLARMAASPVPVAGGFVAPLPEGHLDCDDGISLVMARIKSMDEAQQNIIKIKAKYAAGLVPRQNRRHGHRHARWHLWRSMNSAMTGLMAHGSAIF